MQIKKIRIQNIASLADAEIDFGAGPLQGAPIFLICGDTGAGKSTILDAICLALYGKTPRMTSVARELISIATEDKDKLYANDNAQLLRRGTGWGQVVLTFTGNDGKDYESVWAVQRNHKMPYGRLQREARRILRSLDGAYSESKLEPIEKKIKELSGMDYSQFCRTVMLAQGEFTKFLKSTNKEKSEILEKLTGTEIYSEIGKRIADKYADIKSRWDRLEDQTKTIPLMTDEELAEIKDKIAGETEELARLTSESEETAGKLKWLQESGKLRREMGKMEEELAAIQKDMASEEFSVRKTLVADFHKTEKVRMQCGELSKLISIMEKAFLLLPEARKALEEAQHDLAEAEKRYADTVSEVESKTKEYDAFDTDKVNERLNGLNDRLQKISNLLSQSETCGLQRKVLSETIAEIADKEERLDTSVSLAQSYDAPIEAADKAAGDCARRLTRLSMSVSDVVRELRHDLREGEKCPVCGGVVASKLDDAYFESVLEPLREEKEEAEKRLNGLRALKLAEEKTIGNLTSELKKLRKKRDKVSKEVESAEKAMSKVLADLGYGDSFSSEVEESARRELKEMEAEIKEAKEIQSKGAAVLAEVKKLQAVERKLKKSVDAKREERDKRNTALLKIEADTRVNGERKVELESAIAAFYVENEEISRERVSSLMECNEADINDMERAARDAESALIHKKGASEQLSLQLKDLESRRPELKEDDCEDGLQKQMESLEESRNRLNREIGRLNQQLASDKESRKSVEKILEEMEAIRDRRDRWAALSRMLGDRDGSRFRNVAQSFILHNLLDNANRYMRCFTDRYTLTCNPGSLTILVADSFKPGDAQPSSILSGGESFMASLSLALGLSGLRGGGMGVDIIFIDEGFGSLSSECLGNVMDTLEKLHQLGGRRVGLISHVAEMKERIPVQIHVKRESPALSRVSVVGC